jgi:hypothetical protein
MAAHIGNLAGRMKLAAEEGTGLEVGFSVSCLVPVSISLDLSCNVQRLTSTSSRIATTNTSRMELRHPTTTPGRSDLRMSVGQNTLINPSCSTMTSNYFDRIDILRKNHAF